MGDSPLHSSEFLERHTSGDFDLHLISASCIGYESLDFYSQTATHILPTLTSSPPALKTKTKTKTKTLLFIGFTERGERERERRLFVVSLFMHSLVDSHIPVCVLTRD